jgi:hypothetical protein
VAPTPNEIEDLKEARVRALVDNTAQSVFKYLEELENRKTQVKDRWIWELLQNARDASLKGSGVRVFLHIDSDTLVFRHNGQPFTHKEISHLIFHGSSKGLNEIGHFGSGFITTHLISRRVQVRGRLKSGSSFNFELNRQANSAEELRSLMDGSWNAFLESLQQNDDSGDDFTTEFSYPMSSEAQSLVESGIRSLESCASYVMTFNPELVSIELELQSGRLLLTRGTSFDLEEGVTVTEIVVSQGSRDPKRLLAVTSGTPEITLAVNCVASSVQNLVRVGENVPRLFLAFPLLDSVNFCFPAIINSECFTPNEERGGVYLGSGDTEKVKKNEELLKTACDLLIGLAQILAQHDWGNVGSLADLSGSYEKSWSMGGWFHSLLKDVLIEKFRETPLLRNGARDLIELKNAWIPAHIAESDHQTVWTLISSLRLAEARLPVSEESLVWFRNLARWESISGETNFPEAIGIRELAERVDKCSTLTDFGATLNDHVDSMEWLNTFYVLILKNEQRPLFDDFELLPAQTLALRSRNSLSIDGGIDETLKDLADKLGLGIRSRLLHSGVKEEGVRALVSQAVTQEEVLQDLLAHLRKQAEDPLTATFKEVNISLFGWIVEHDRLDCLESFPLITCANETVTASTNNPGRAHLAPLECWPEKARAFRDLFPQTRVLTSAYYELIPAHEAWDDLARSGIVYLSPLIDVTEPLTEFLPDEPLAEGEHRSMSLVEQSQLLFLTEDDIGLIDSARKSRKGNLRLLTFLLDYVVDADGSAFIEGEVQCQCGASHRYYRAKWLGKLKHRSWLSGKHNRSVKPSAEALVEIIRENQKIRTQLTEGPGIQLIQALGISPSDLSLRLLSPDEGEKVAYIRVLSDIQATVGTGVEHLSAFASAVREDPEVLNIINHRAEIRSRIRGNQKIGAQIEKLLAESLRGLGFKVTRTGVGSDYEVETDLTDEGEEFILAVEGHSRTHLIEIKCTTTDDVRMTPKQAEVASQQQDRFSLCVVTLLSQELAGADVSESARFVVDIGARIEPLWNNYMNIENTKKDTELRVGDIVLEISKEQTRFRIARVLWDSGMDLNAFVTFLQSSVLVPTK